MIRFITGQHNLKKHDGLALLYNIYQYIILIYYSTVVLFLRLHEILNCLLMCILQVLPWKIICTYCHTDSYNTVYPSCLDSETIAVCVVVKVNVRT